MPCQWELVLQSLLQVAGAGFDVYTVAPGSAGYEKMSGPPSAACTASRVALAPKGGLAPFETEAPVDSLKTRAEAVTGIEVLKLINRRGPFHGYSLEVRLTDNGT